MRVLHVNDVAHVGSTLVREARSRGLDWTLIDSARQDPSWPPRSRAVRRALRGAAWEVRLARAAMGRDLVHVHGGTVHRHTAWLPLPMALHLHGSDARIARYLPGTRTIVEDAVRCAVLVFYTTPDLAEHVLDLRPDARLHPVTVDPAHLPQARALREDAPIVFPSRWDEAKGGQRLLEVLDAVKAAAPGVRLEGVDWGDLAPEAARRGVHLRPRSSHADYVAWLSGARAAVGQATGVMGASELETLAIGVPLVMPLLARWYSNPHPSTQDVPVLAGPVEDLAEIPEATGAALEHLQDLERPTRARAWVQAHHGPQVGVDSLLEAYGQWEDGRP